MKITLTVVSFDSNTVSGTKPRNLTPKTVYDDHPQNLTWEFPAPTPPPQPFTVKAIKKL